MTGCFFLLYNLVICRNYCSNVSVREEAILRGSFTYVRIKGGGGGLAKAYALYKKYHFSYTKCVLGGGGGGGNKIFDFVRTYYVSDPKGYFHLRKKSEM